MKHPNDDLICWRIKCIVIAVFLSVLGNGCSKQNATPPIKQQYNVNQIPPITYTGLWIVYETNNNMKIMETHYVSGKKSGVETRWYLDSHCKMSIHTFEHGILDGKSIKYRNNTQDQILVEGTYKAGQAWEGLFLESWNSELDMSLDVVDRDLPYWIREYREGQLLRRFQKR